MPKDQPQFLYRNVQLKDRRHVESLKSPSTQQTEPQKINLEEYWDQKQDQEALIVSTTKPQEEDWDQTLALPTPSVKWGHLVNQLNQDPQENSVADSGWGMVAMEWGCRHHR